MRLAACPERSRRVSIARFGKHPFIKSQETFEVTINTIARFLLEIAGNMSMHIGRTTQERAHGVGENAVIYAPDLDGFSHANTFRHCRINRNTATMIRLDGALIGRGECERSHSESGKRNKKLPAAWGRLRDLTDVN